MSQRRKRLRRRQKSRVHVIVFQGLTMALIAFLVIALAGTASAVTIVSGWLDDLPDYKAPGAFDVARATKVYSADGKLLARLYLENREVVPISKISTDLANAVVAIEDERFYSHNGVDAMGIIRALFTNMAAGDTEEGASTITQQYIRNTVLLDERTDITLERKIREAYLAIELEKRYDKQQVLEMYLNAIYFGEGAYGAQAASRTFFSKRANELTLSEAALLAGLPQQPTRLNPFENPEGAIARRNQVLRSMLKNGFINQAQFDQAMAEPLQLKRAWDPEDGIYSAHYFVSQVKKELQARFTQAVVFKGGLSVYTTLDTRMQKYAEEAVADGLPKDGPEGALVSIEPDTGYVKAMVGGRDYRKNKFNLATQAHRQPGSSFKTFVLVTALGEGMPPSYKIDSSSPAVIPTKPKPWIVSNSEGSGHGAMTLARATHMSVNTVFARLIWGVGAKKVAATAKKMGIESKLGEYPSMALGAANVTPLEMASAYGTLATGGVHYEPTFITKVVDPAGEVLLEAKPKGERSLSPELAKAATDVLKGVITSGTARRANIGRPAAGKTGTSQLNRDVWFVGYTPQLVTAVWSGYRTEQTIYVNGRRAYGGTVCAPIWADFMSKALKGEKKLDFPDAGRLKFNAKKFKVPSGTEEGEDEKATVNGGAGSAGGTTGRPNTGGTNPPPKDPPKTDPPDDDPPDDPPPPSDETT